MSLIHADLAGLVAQPHRAGRERLEVHYLRRPAGIVGDELQGDEPVDRLDFLENENISFGGDHAQLFPKGLRHPE
ncbi:MAG: hypothetical protein P9F75_00510 [Candidatus Contendobacter sp.]|nr:hypothetical protein [Candidatus Contendobacter sp.]